MLLPLGDSPNPPGLPLVTYGLIAANVAVFALVTVPLAGTAPDPSDAALFDYVRALNQHGGGDAVSSLLQQMSAYDLFVFRHAFRPSAPTVEGLFASLFLHAGVMHLFGNMLMLWIYGDNVEHRLGRLGYLAAYIGTGVAATLFHAAFDLDSPLPLIGASGAISGVLGLYFLWFPHNQVRLLLLFFPFLMNVVTVRARTVLGFFLLADNLLPFLLTRGMGVGGVAYGAHIGGFLAGLAVAWLMDRRELIRPPAEYAAAPVLSRGVRPEGIGEALAAGEMQRAAQLYFAQEPGQSPPPAASDSLALADWLRDAGKSQAALTVYRRLLRDHPRGSEAAAAHLGAGLVQMQALGQPTPAYQHFLEALDCDPDPEVAGQARAAIEAIVAGQKLQIGRPRGAQRY